MTMKSYQWFLIVFAVIVLIATILQFRPALAAAPNGLRAVLATTSTQIVGPQSINKLFSADNTCNSRVITTYANPIMLSFDALSSTSPSGINGHLQPASTTVAYDSALYGCGLWSAWGFTASTSPTISEFD
jgi:hypothetical protein